MNKFYKSRKVVAVILALTMIFAMGAVSFADTPSAAATDVKVSLYLQDVYRIEVPEPIQSVWTENPISVTVQSGQSVKDAVNAAAANPANKLTDVVWSGDFLKSITYDGIKYENEDSYRVDPVTGENIYEGLSWMYFDNTPANMPADTNDYPTVSMGANKLVKDASITLSFEALQYRWK